MEEEQLAVTIGKNIMRLRKTANMTQLELAERLNYSDKSISKWEQGNGIPDIRILIRLSQLFGVTLDDLVREHEERKILSRNARFIRRMVIICCAVALCWLVAVVCFVLSGIIMPALKSTWLSFVYVIPVSAVVVLVFACVWRYKIARIVSVSLLIWTTLACCYLTAYVCGYTENMWLLFLIGIPLQTLALFFFVWWKKVHFTKS